MSKSRLLLTLSVHDSLTLSVFCALPHTTGRSSFHIWQDTCFDKNQVTEASTFVFGNGWLPTVLRALRVDAGAATRSIARFDVYYLHVQCQTLTRCIEVLEGLKSWKLQTCGDHARIDPPAITGSSESFRTHTIWNSNTKY